MGHVRIIVYDLASLDLRWGPGRTTVRLYGRDLLLAALDVPTGEDPRITAFRAADEALALARVPSPRSIVVYREDPRSRHRIALYNPYTAQISLGSSPRTTVLGGDRPLHIPVDGLAGDYHDEVLHLPGGLTWRAVEGDLHDLSRRVAAHFE